MRFNSTYKMTRRDFIRLSSAVFAMYPLATRAEKTAARAEQKLKEPWRTLATVQQHLLPSGKAVPGAMDIHALAYLQNMLKAPDMSDEDRQLIYNGVGWLNGLSQQLKQKDFIDLNVADRETLLRKVENSRKGQRWLSLLLTYLLEALVSDPVYGGNANGLGWKWLQHQPGFPRPPKDKTYPKLAARRYRITKA